MKQFVYKKILWLVELIKFVIHRTNKDRLLPIAAALTFTSLLSLVPLLSISFTILGAFPAFKEIGVQIKNFIFSHFVPTSSQVLQSNLDQIISHTSRLTLMGSVTLLITALLTLSTIERAFNEIWCVKRSRRGISAFMLYWAVLTLMPLFFGVSLAVSSYLFSLPLVTATANSLGLQNFFLFMSSFILEVSAFTLLYLAVPYCRVRLGHALWGGLLVGIFFEAIKKIFALYISEFTSYEVLYGALASIPVFLMWVYIFWVLVLIGAELVNALSYDHDSGRSSSTALFLTAYHWLGILWLAQQRGESLSLQSLLQQYGSIGNIEPEDMLEKLMAAKFVHQLDSGDISLARDLNQLTVGEFYTLLPWKLPINTKMTDHIWEQRLLQLLIPCQETLQSQLDVPLTTLYQEQASEHRS